VADRMRFHRRRGSGAPAALPGAGRRRLTAFIGVAVLCLAATTGYLLLQRHRADAAADVAAAQEAGRTRLRVQDVLAVPHLVVRNTEAGPSYGKIALIPWSDPSGPRAIVDVSCNRVYGTARGTICLQEVDGPVTSYRAVFLDARFATTGTQALGGTPSRARLSADAGWAASTVFIDGHSYADLQFSTETVITDMATQTSLGSLETWHAYRDGVEVGAQDRNYWGVTFIGDGPQFYATLGTGGKRYLVHGDATTKTMTVLGSEGACPSVSPDGSQVVYKQQDPVSHNDRFVRMSTPGGTTNALQEGRQVDDQVAWLDEETVAYALGKGVKSSVEFDLWSAPVAGGAPRLLAHDAASPSLVLAPAT
jgi:hypothetical protein